MGCTQNECQSKFNSNIKKKRSAYPILVGILIAILPKCPFCIAAYSSAIVLCSGTKLYNQTPDWTNYISILLAFVTLLMILLNFRGKRTWFAAGLVVLGSSLIIGTELFTGELTNYYYGAFLLLMGVWVNASFMFFFRKWINVFHPIKRLLTKMKSGTATND